jgi:hypothetical protein
MMTGTSFSEPEKRTNQSFTQIVFWRSKIRLLYPTWIQSQRTMNEDFAEDFDVISLDGHGDDYIYNASPEVIVPAINNPHFYVDLANNSYDFIMNYQEEHFQRMLRIEDNYPLGSRNLPPTIPIWNVGARIQSNPQTFVRYTNAAEHLANLVDPFFGNVTCPGVSNQESDIVIPTPNLYDDEWIRNIECTDTRSVFTLMLTEPVPHGVRCYDGAPIDVEGFPLTQHYFDSPEDVVAHGPHPAFTTINRDNPTDAFPSSFLLPRWPTGPDRAITEANPLYQFARSNIPMQEWELRELPDIHIFNDNFFEQYDMFTNIFATAVRNGPHRMIDYFKNGAEYAFDPPNLNCQFSVLHHNFYGECFVGDVYDVDPVGELNTRARYESVPNPMWDQMGDLELMNHIDNAFLNCRNDAERTDLWTSMVPSLLQYPFSFCSVCMCRLPLFYFSSSQRKSKRTHRACRHCEGNRNIKISLINRILGSADYFQAQRECSVCHTRKSKYRFTKRQWRQNDISRECLDCSH